MERMTQISVLLGLVLTALSYEIVSVYPQTNTNNAGGSKATSANDTGTKTNSSATTNTGKSNTTLVSIVRGASSSTISKPYDPSPITIKAGIAVTWTNNDSTLHTVTSGLPEQGAVGTIFDSSIMSPRQTFTHTFAKAGTFDYSCTLHPFMHGQVIVK